MWRSGPTTVRPQPVTEQSLMESVAGGYPHHQHHHHGKYISVILLQLCKTFWPKFCNVFTDHSLPLNLNSIWEENFVQIENMDFHFFRGGKQLYHDKIHIIFIFFIHENCDNECFGRGGGRCDDKWLFCCIGNFQQPLSTKSRVIFTLAAMMRMKNMLSDDYWDDSNERERK